MNQMNRFQQTLRLRTLFKELSQISWSVTQMERRYPFEALSDEEMNELCQAYLSYGGQLQKLADEVKEYGNQR